MKSSHREHSKNVYVCISYCPVQKVTVVESEEMAHMTRSVFLNFYRRYIYIYLSGETNRSRVKKLKIDVNPRYFLGFLRKIFQNVRLWTPDSNLTSKSVLRFLQRNCFFLNVFRTWHERHQHGFVPVKSM